VGRGEGGGKGREGWEEGKGKSQRSVPANKNLRLHPWVGKFCDFLALSVNISKTVADTANVTIND